MINFLLLSKITLAKWGHCPIPSVAALKIKASILWKKCLTHKILGPTFQIIICSFFSLIYANVVPDYLSHLFFESCCPLCRHCAVESKYLTNPFSSSNGHSSSRGRPRQRLPTCLLYTSPSPRDGLLSRMPSSA